MQRWRRRPGSTQAVGDPVPAFGWNAVSGADHYEFQISGASRLQRAHLGRTHEPARTRGSRSIKSIADCTCTWRVRAVTAKHVGGWSSPVTYDKVTARRDYRHAGRRRHGHLPNAARADTGSRSTAPRSTRCWSATRRASPASPPRRPRPTFYVPPTWLAPGIHYWSVAPKDADGNVGSYSTAAVVHWVWPNTVNNLTVTDTVDNTGDDNADDTIFEPRFSWDPVQGAARYEIEINTDSNWATRLDRLRQRVGAGHLDLADALLPTATTTGACARSTPPVSRATGASAATRLDPGDTLQPDVRSPGRRPSPTCACAT